jgi:hypothetical protein
VWLTIPGGYSKTPLLHDSESATWNSGNIHDIAQSLHRDLLNLSAFCKAQRPLKHVFALLRVNKVTNLTRRRHLTRDMRLDNFISLFRAAISQPGERTIFILN